MLIEDNFQSYRWCEDDWQEGDLLTQQALNYPSSDSCAVCGDAKDDLMHRCSHQHLVCTDMRDVPHLNVFHLVSSSERAILWLFVRKIP